MRIQFLDHGARLSTERLGVARWAGFAAAFVYLSFLANLPAQAIDLPSGAWLAVSLEIAFLLLALVLVPPLRLRLAPPVRHATALCAILLLAVKAGNAGIGLALGRQLNLLLDAYLLRSVANLLAGTFGVAVAVATGAGVAILMTIIYVLALRSVAVLQAMAGTRPGRLAILAIAVLTAGLYLTQRATGLFGTGHPVAAVAAGTVAQQWRTVQRTLAAQSEFRMAERTDRFRDAAPGALLTRLEGIHVIVVFVESYGRNALEGRTYAASLAPVLDRMEKRLRERGLTVQSGWLVSPIAGGQSWLAHGTLLSGLWLDSQRRYDLLVSGDRKSLTHYFREAGHRVVAVRPAITRAWPEGAYFGYTETYFADDLGYAGPPYAWVTVPDQYTLAFLERRVRASTPTPSPLFAEVVLISSHAPFTPLPPVIEDWSSIGDGALFARWVDRGDPPGVVWRNIDRARDQYGAALAYVLDVVASYAENFVDEHTMLIVLGDHQPAPLLMGNDASRSVPVHVISGNPNLVTPFDELGFVRGARPDPGGAELHMDEFRDWFLDAYSDDR
ncbi:MAG: hypothetical protein ACE5Q3_04535 [Alphaproteobacteria bacterium]